ncbi:MAG: branched-chain amino acid ABC transporter permease [Magnetospirillum gryphiswaldense]|nr:branched-chain amino acid ABC transporter permease [Magnetospirillum gryphiswaldense]
MLESSIQFILAGLTSGAIYALVGLGFTIIYNASHVINFAQGEFIVIGGMSTVALMAAGLPLPVAIVLATLVTMAVGMALARFAIQPARDADVVALIIITIGASIFLRGIVQLVFGKDIHSLPPFSGETPLNLMGATLMPQSLWVMGVAAALILVMAWFFNATLAGKAMLATAYNALAARLMGVDTKWVLLSAFALSALLGAVGGIVVTPITFVSYESGIMLGLKGFSAAVLGGLGNGVGAVAGGLILGIVESMSAGYISSAYKDAIAFVIILVVLVARPNGLFGKKGIDRV